MTRSCVLDRLPVANVDDADGPWYGWRSQAACRGHDPNTFYPLRGESAAPALAVCHGCDVQTPCLLAGIHENEGVWGGVSARQRRVLRRFLRSALGVTADEEDDEESDAA